jgi:ribosome-associated translation inhibitor RaiA
MKLSFKYFQVRSTNALDAWVEKQISGLQVHLKIDEAKIRLACEQEASPPFIVQVHLVTPGPDVFAEGRDHTLRAALAKVMAQLRNKISNRAARRLQRLRSGIALPALHARNGGNAS